MSRIAKRAAFAHRQRNLRYVDRVVRANRNSPGFLGAVTNFSISTKSGETRRFEGVGALFIGAAR